MNNNDIVRFFITFASFSLIAPILSSNNNSITDVDKNSTINESNGMRFQRILRRKRRFLLFPPGAAIVVCIFFKFLMNFFYDNQNF